MTGPSGILLPFYRRHLSLIAAMLRDRVPPAYVERAVLELLVAALQRAAKDSVVGPPSPS